MAHVYDGIDERQRAWIARQALFFVGTAPLAGDGHVNVSPKGPIGSLSVLDERTVAYLDVLGSGAETIAHLRENGRITIMFCAFDGNPNIVRLYGRGETILADDPRATQFLTQFPSYPGARSVIVVDVDRVSTSCGYAVPRMQLVEDRDQLLGWADRKGADGLVAYRAEKNAVSIDGLPAHP